MSEWDELYSEVEQCSKCSLCKSRTQIVFGDGDINSKILFIGEAPGAKEDLEGKPFVGHAGKILGDLLQKNGFKRENIYITNILKCRPPNNANPTKKQVEMCTDYLKRQIDLIKPDFICPLGNFSTAYILELFGFESKPIGLVHGNLFEFDADWGKTNVLPLHHPAATIYNRRLTDVLKNDFSKVKKYGVK